MHILPIDGIDKDVCSVGNDCMKKVSVHCVAMMVHHDIHLFRNSN